MQSRESTADEQEAGATGESATEALDEQAAVDESILMLPDYTDLNPYQTLLANALRERGYGVTLRKGLPFPLLRAVWDDDTDVDVVHFHWLHYYVLADSPLLTAAKIVQFFLDVTLYRVFFDGTVVWTVHNRLEHEQRWPTVERLVKRLFLTYLCERAIVHCKQAHAELAPGLGASSAVTERVDVVPHGHYVDVYDNDITREAARERLDVPEDEQMFLFIGSVRPYKQVPNLVQAYQSIDADDTRLCIVGKPWSEEHAATVRRHCGDRADIETRLEIVPESEFQVYLNAADAAVLPFRADTLTSGSVILAMSFGTAVVAPRIGCLPETLAEDGAILYDPAADSGLEQALEAALKVDLYTMGARNYERIVEFDWERIAAETRDVYEAALGTDVRT